MEINNKINGLTKELWYIFGDSNGTEYDEFIESNGEVLKNLKVIVDQMFVSVKKDEVIHIPIPLDFDDK